MSKKRIGVLAINLSSGGAEKVVSLLLKKLSTDYEVFLILLNNDIHFTIPENVEVVFLGNSKPGLFKKIFSFFVAINSYSKFLSKYKIDISVSFLIRPNLINAFLKFFHPKVKVIISERCFPSIAYKSNFLRYYIYKMLIPILYNKADVLFSNSVYINRDLKDNFRVKIDMKVLYNPVELKVDEIELANKNVFNVVFVGKLKPIKNPILLLRALTFNLNEKMHTVFLGDGVLKEFLLSYCKQNDLENVCFEGIVNNVNDYLLNSSVFVLTSKSEGFPNVIIEAMSCGVPIISTNCMSGPLEILNDNQDVIIEEGSFLRVKYGLMINVDDEIGLSNALKEIFYNHDLRNELSSLSFLRAKDYSLDVIYNGFKNKILTDGYV
ncbi:glycosyltransferase [Flavobacterium sp.]|uniref:glycosyltransferase n=1 Tax=Flavobacterium sp. TaxID=239 RepID=UPI003A91F6F8